MTSFVKVHTSATLAQSVTLGELFEIRSRRRSLRLAFYVLELLHGPLCLLLHSLVSLVLIKASTGGLEQRLEIVFSSKRCPLLALRVSVISARTMALSKRHTSLVVFLLSRNLSQGQLFVIWIVSLGRQLCVCHRHCVSAFVLRTFLPLVDSGFVGGSWAHFQV